MGQLRIHCGYCGGTWDVYGRDNWHEKTARTCPHCDSRIDGQTWENQILPSFGAMMDSNRELMKDHTGYNQPIFTVDYIEDHFFPDPAREAATAAENLEETVEEMQGGIDDLRGTVEDMRGSIDDLRGTLDNLAGALVTAAILKAGEDE